MFHVPVRATTQTNVPVVYSIADVGALREEEVEDGEQLAVVRHQGFAHPIVAEDKLLQEGQGREDDVRMVRR